MSESILHWTWLMPLVMAVSFVAILLFGKRMPKKGSEIGIAAVGLCFVFAILSGSAWISHVNDAHAAANITTEAAQGSSFEDMVKRQRQVADIVQADPNVQALMSTAGGSGGGNSAANTGRLIVTLKPLGERANVADVVTELRRKLARLPGIEDLTDCPDSVVA